MTRTNTFNKPLATTERVTSPTRKDFEDTIQRATGNRKQSKAAGANHHVSFNINNAIYSTRQEIPISIMKNTSTSNNEGVVSPYHNSANSGSTPNKNGILQFQSSLKKSTTTSAIKQQQQSENSSQQQQQQDVKQSRGFFNNTAKPNRTADTKTTIL